MVGCGVRNLPTVYTRTSKYVNWIEQIKNDNTGEKLKLKLNF